MKLVTLLKLYKQEKPQLSIRTIHKYESVIKLFIKDTNIDNVLIARDEVIKWRNKILSRASAVTCNNYHRHLKSLFNFAVQINAVNENIFNTIPPLRTPKNSYKLIDADTLGKLIKFLKYDSYYSKLSWFYIAMIDIFKLTGIRRRQLIGIKWQDIDFTNNTIYLDPKYSKNCRENTVPMNQILKEHFLIIKKHSNKVNRSDQVLNITKFINSYEAITMKEEHVSRLFVKWSNKLNIKISAHRFRHTAATKIVNQCKDIKSAQEMLGHTNIKTTMGYVNVNIDNLREAQEFL